MTKVSEQLKTLRLNARKSQKQIAELLGTTQQSVFRYESGLTFPNEETLLWYADYFDVSLDYIFGRTDKLRGKVYSNTPKSLQEDGQFADFIEMCFDPNSAANAKLKEAIVKLFKENIHD